MKLENLINQTNEYYLENDIAIIYKKPTPILVCKVDYKKNLVKEENHNVDEIGYQLFEPWQISVAPKYSYNGDYDGSYSEHIVGVRIGTRFDFIRLKRQTSYRTNIFIAIAYQYEYEWGHYTPRETNYFDAGIGLRQAVGSRSSLYVMAGWHLYDSLNDAWFADAIPTISVGFEI